MAFVRLTGVTYYDPDLAHNSYVLYTGSDAITRLIDLNGAVVQEWPFAGVPPRIIDPALTGDRLGDVGVQLAPSGDTRGGIYANGTVGQLTWTGERVWEWGEQAPGGAARQNHDWELLPNGNRLLLVTIPRIVPGLADEIVGDQGLYEVTPDGEIVWEWRAGDHLDELGFSEDGWKTLQDTAQVQPVVATPEVTEGVWEGRRTGCGRSPDGRRCGRRGLPGFSVQWSDCSGTRSLRACCRRKLVSQ
ncbi:hypothetical protein OG563_46205 [Nocardia vinacea]|uniref:Uncharacterized protein n=1 Tax=Nocardia vinacea TaxID=96468 RepID=A0ABZ1YSW5_9NOCA|nr:aryl-sulfate sulfotransferase [Nocardia vinacea]